MTTLFISDLHLHETRPAITHAFYAFLQERAQGVDALYILGDFFDAWIGDDDDAPLNKAVAQHLRALSDQGTSIYLMHGNRDFLLGEDFATAAGATLISDPIIIEINAEPVLLMHGDSLCTQDVEYQAFRQQVRSAAWQQHVLSQPIAARRALAAQIRAQSESKNSIKAEDIMDVTPAEVVRVMQEHGVKRLIHGHTHRPARHSLTIDGAPAERIVLGDWHDTAWCVQADAAGIDLQHWPISD